jgi:hypothetical protein
MRFPDYSQSKAKDHIKDLERLMDRTLSQTEYIDGKSASRLIAGALRAYKVIVAERSWEDDPFTRHAAEDGDLFKLSLAAIFDLVTNAEYLHGRLVNTKWIYCNRPDTGPRAYYSALKQCPKCCLDRGLEPRLTGAQHKPSSHHIGEITTTVTAFLLELIVTANDEPLAVATITKQSHDVDAIGFRDDLLLLFEVKSSPMVTYPVALTLEEPMTDDASGEPQELDQHSLVTITLQKSELFLFIPHRELMIPVGAKTAAEWPYPAFIAAFSEPTGFLTYLSAWLELYYAYSVPKVERQGRDVVLAYLVNGWGDEIDSNKTKPGLGRTDDIKKGTYQLLKFGAYYRDDDAPPTVRGALVSNLDPIFLRGDYLDALTDVRWGRGEDFRDSVDDQNIYIIEKRRLRNLYDALVTFNDPLLNDPILAELFDLEEVDRRLSAGELDALLDRWETGGPDAVQGKLDLAPPG